MHVIKEVYNIATAYYDIMNEETITKENRQKLDFIENVAMSLSGISDRYDFLMYLRDGIIYEKEKMNGWNKETKSFDVPFYSYVDDKALDFAYDFFKYIKEKECDERFNSYFLENPSKLSFVRQMDMSYTDKPDFETLDKLLYIITPDDTLSIEECLSTKYNAYLSIKDKLDSYGIKDDFLSLVVDDLVKNHNDCINCLHIDPDTDNGYLYKMKEDVEAEIYENIHNIEDLEVNYYKMERTLEKLFGNEYPDSFSQAVLDLNGMEFTDTRLQSEFNNMFLPAITDKEDMDDEEAKYFTKYFTQYDLYDMSKYHNDVDTLKSKLKISYWTVAYEEEDEPRHVEDTYEIDLKFYLQNMSQYFKEGYCLDENYLTYINVSKDDIEEDNEEDTEEEMA